MINKRDLIRKTAGVLAILCTLISWVEAREFFVSTSAEIRTVMTSAQPGDTLTMESGIWQNQKILFHGHGTEAAPILLRAEKPGFVQLLGTSYLEISGSWLVVDGLLFRNGSCADGQPVIEFRSSYGRANHCRLTNTVIYNYNPQNLNTDYKWVSLYGKNNRVDHCHFEGKKHSGTTLVVWLSTSEDRSNFHQIDHNYFGPRPELGYNGGETIRIGTSDYSLVNSNTIVEYNVFDECNGETEIISSKSCENIYRYNTFVNSKGCLTLRHGNRCTVEGNFFFGNRNGDTGGVRIIGEDHVVVNNYFQDLEGSGYKSALCITKGVVDSPLNRYFQVKRAVIAFNTFVNCRSTFLIGYGNSDDQTLPPEDCAIANNAVQTAYDVIKIGDQQGAPVDFSWAGNIFWGDELGIPNPGGVRWLDPLLVLVADELYRPSAGSPLIDAAAGDYSQIITDIDGQARTTPFDVGCDEESQTPVTIQPLFKADVDVDWFTPGPQVVQVVPGPNTILEALDLIGEDDTLELVSDAAFYELSEKIKVDRRIVIRAARNLHTKPVIIPGTSGPGATVIFELHGQGELYLDGVILDGASGSVGSVASLIATSETSFPEYFRVCAKHCDFRNVSGHFLRTAAGTQADTISFKDCIFSAATQSGLCLNEEAVASGRYNVRHLEIENCTFWNLDKEAVDIYGGDAIPFTIGPVVRINHCTFDACGKSGTSTLYLVDVDNTVVTNSIVSNGPVDVPSIRIYGWAYIEFCDIFNTGIVELNRDAHQYNGMVAVDPEYRDPLIGDFTLSAASPLYGLGKDGLTLGDLRWAENQATSVLFGETPGSSAEFRLQGNYPNPFNGSTWIFYTLSRKTFVEVLIYDLTGGLVAGLERAEKAPGKYSLEWQPANLPSGLYFCRIMAEGHPRVWKMMYIQ